MQHFTKDRYDALANTSRQPDEHGGRDADVDAPLFACHLTLEGRETACAGWLAVEGRNHIGIRLALVTGRISPEVLDARPGWPELYDSFVQMVEAQRYDD